MTPLPSFVAYYRVSTDRQGRSGLGLDAQREAVAGQVQRAGGAIVADFTEIESGKRADRPELRAALAEAKRHRATLIIARLDRLSRNMAFIANLMDARVDFIACDNPHATRLTLHILAAVAEHEREMISARTKAALAIARARGVRLGNPRPALARERAAAIHRGRADWFAATVRDTIGGMAGEGMNLRAIARELDRRGVPTARGGVWQAAQVRAVIARVQVRFRLHLRPFLNNCPLANMTLPANGRPPSEKLIGGRIRVRPEKADENARAARL